VWAFVCELGRVCVCVCGRVYVVWASVYEWLYVCLYERVCVGFLMCGCFGNMYTVL